MNNVNKDIASVSSTDKIMWGKTELKKGQIGKLTILKPINQWSEKDGELGNVG
ncbi:hypothetical protein [Psychrobacillus sp. NPDC093200]|uniref:hypothetical protein n=1 Tax=Psychrobacillus sp. NPDC093200 TaxID=3390656 RepID=UPI003CFDF431